MSEHSEEAETEALLAAVLDKPQRRPRVALMGEFSAGKSTLSNLLIGRSALPVNVTATQLPPVWMSFGEAPPCKVDLQGEEIDVSPDLSDVDVHKTHHIKVAMKSKFLEQCDLIDMPGISDPNMAADVWQRVLPEADIIVWCSHATQAWRQSEAAVWNTVPNEFYDRSLLLLTRMDRILSERDRSRVVKRVQKETDGMFRKVLPVSLIQAIESNGSAAVWESSGATSVVKTLLGLVDEVDTGKIGRKVSRVVSQKAPTSALDGAIGDRVVAKPVRVVMPSRVRPRPLVSKAPPGSH